MTCAKDRLRTSEKRKFCRFGGTVKRSQNGHYHKHHQNNLPPASEITRPSTVHHGAATSMSSGGQIPQCLTSRVYVGLRDHHLWGVLLLYKGHALSSILIPPSSSIRSFFVELSSMFIWSTCSTFPLDSWLYYWISVLLGLYMSLIVCAISSFWRCHLRTASFPVMSTIIAPQDSNPINPPVQCTNCFWMVPFRPCQTDRNGNKGVPFVIVGTFFPCRKSINQSL